MKSNQRTGMDELALSCKRLKANGLSIIQIAKIHDLTYVEVLAILSRNL